MNPLIKTYAKKANKSLSFVEMLWTEIEETLLTQGMLREDKRFAIYTTTLLKKKLKINEANPLLIRFKQFLENKKLTLND